VKEVLTSTYSSRTAQKQEWRIWPAPPAARSLNDCSDRQLASTALRAQAMCLLARVGLITPAAKEAAERRQVAMRLQEELRRERKAQ
jgi:hypothetical protein